MEGAGVMGESHQTVCVIHTIFKAGPYPVFPLPQNVIKSCGQ